MESKEDYITIRRSEYEFLVNTIKELQQEVVILRERVKEMEGQLSRNSNNSHKPPSSDGYRKGIKNSREKSGKQQGAQPGHEGKTLEIVANPDYIITHKLTGKYECGNELDQLPLKSLYRRQVFDLPKKLIEITEHQIESKQCVCGKIHEAGCEVKGVTQYGVRIKALAVYLNQYQLVPYERVQELISDCFGVSISDWVLDKSNQNCYAELEQTEETIKNALIKSNVIHNDETGLRCNKKLQWIHVSSTDTFTHFSIQQKRGSEGMDAIGILPEFKGISVHDRFSSYDKYGCGHSFCNAHLLRELKYVHEELDKKWASEISGVMVGANELKKQNGLNETTIQEIETKYSHVLNAGLQEESYVPIQNGKRGRKAKPKSRLLFEAFRDKRTEILKFIYNNDVPFDNNLAERDIRMVKLKQKISGCFRTQQGAIVFCRIRSYLSTVRKQEYSVLNAIEQALLGRPIILA
jgi:transposase